MHLKTLTILINILNFKFFILIIFHITCLMQIVVCKRNINNRIQYNINVEFFKNELLNFFFFFLFYS